MQQYLRAGIAQWAALSLSSYLTSSMNVLDTLKQTTVSQLQPSLATQGSHQPTFQGYHLDNVSEFV